MAQVERALEILEEQLEEARAEVRRLQKAIATLRGGSRRPGRPAGRRRGRRRGRKPGQKKGRKLSAATRRKMAAAQQKRWAKSKGRKKVKARGGEIPIPLGKKKRAVKAKAKPAETKGVVAAS